MPHSDSLTSHVGITDVTLRDAHQSILATRVRTEDLLPLCEHIDRTGYWSAECWGGATYDACLRFLGEDPWERLDAFRAAMPNTKLQMLLRGKNLLGYRHQDETVLAKFVELSSKHGMDVYRVFDAVNSVDSMASVLKHVNAVGGHAQGTLSYTTSPVHNLDYWIDLAKRVEDLGVDSIAIKDMAGLLTPYAGFALVSKLKETLSVPIHMQCHATTGFAIGTYLKAVEAGIDNIDTAISSWSLTYGHAPTETIVSMLNEGPRKTQCDLKLMVPVANACRELRERYSKHEGTLKGIDARIIDAQVPGGMLSNLESQLKEQNALNRFDEVMEEIPKVRQELGYIPLVTPTSQIVGAQSVINILSGKRYGVMTAEVSALLRGEYGETPAPVDVELKKQAMEQSQTPAPAFAQGKAELTSKLSDKKPSDEEALSYIMLPQSALKSLNHQGDASAFEPRPLSVKESSPSQWSLSIDGQSYLVKVSPAGDIQQVQSGANLAAALPTNAAPVQAAAVSAQVESNLAGTLVSYEVAVGQQVEKGSKVAVVEALKMEVDVFSEVAGTVVALSCAPGATVQAGQVILTLS